VINFSRKLQPLHIVNHYKRYRTEAFSAGVYKHVAMWRVWCLGEVCSRQRRPRRPKRGRQ